MLGIVKDGRPVYTPMHGGGKTIDSCEVDVCNGLELNGHYSYVSTLFHPYIVGCYGPGSSPNIAQGSSSNPRSCNVTDDENLAIRLALSGLMAISYYLI